jgi:DNA-binding Lrp family transcriptional regulator
MSHETALDDTDQILWDQLAPHLDQAVAALSEADRSAILLRFYERMPLRSVGERMGVSEEAARKRVSRALERLREFLDRRGVKLSGAALGAVLAEKTVQAASAALAGAVVKVSLAAASASAPAMLPQLARDTLDAWHWAKLKLAVGLGAGSLALIFVAVTAGGLLTRHAAPQAVTAIASPVALSSTGAPAADAERLTVAAPAARGDALVLRLVAADTGLPVVGAVIEREVLDRQTGRVVPGALLKLTTSEHGISEVPLPSEPPGLLLVRSRIDGFVDTTLAWSPAYGEAIPAQYTMRLPHSVPIGGLVVDEDDKPVSGAEVRVSVRSDQSPDVPHVTTAAGEETLTDAEGRWHIDRFAKEAFSPKNGSGPTLVFQALHPDYFQEASQAYGGDLRDQVRAQLLARAYLFKLARIVALRGMVMDTNGQPVPNVVITADNPRERPGATGITNQSDGTFAMAACRAGANWLRFQTPGFALAELEVELKPDMAPLRVTLQPAKLLRLRILDRNSFPVPGAGVTNRTFVSSRPRVLFSQQTDADGRVRWDNPPDGPLSFEVAAAGLRSTNVLVTVDGQEHVIKLAPALTVLGTVRDAATDKPIPRFTLSPSTGLSMGLIWRNGLAFKDGTFRYVDEEHLIGSKNPRRFKFEAEGYAPVVSREVQPDAGEVQLDIEMQPAASTTVTLLLPDGAPATDADIRLVPPGENLMVAQGGLRHPPYRGSREWPALDDQGRFTLPPCD